MLASGTIANPIQIIQEAVTSLFIILFLEDFLSIAF
jgi:hypothetical protein